MKFYVHTPLPLDIQWVNSTSLGLAGTKPDLSAEGVSNFRLLMGTISVLTKVHAEVDQDLLYRIEKPHCDNPERCPLLGDFTS